MSGKFLFISFRNKKINEFSGVEKIIGEFSGGGYDFDKISFVDYVNPQEIARAVEEGKNLYKNTVVFYPAEMEGILVPFIGRVYGGEFDKNYLHSGENYVFLLKEGNSASEIIDILNEKYAKNSKRAYIKTVGVAPPQIDEIISYAKKKVPEIEYRVKQQYGDCRIEMIYGEGVLEDTSEEIYREILTRLQDNVYALEDVELTNRFVELLKLRGLKVCVAESFTGGGISKRLVDIPGVSEVYNEGLNTYSNEAKHLRLGVSGETLEKFGAVSSQTAKEMALGLFKTGYCNLAISTTGIAGPKSDNTKKPVGLAYIAVATAENVYVYELNLKGSRKTITETAINLALFYAYKAIK